MTVYDPTFEDYCYYCEQRIDECECGLDPDLASMQGQEEHDEIDAGTYDD